MLLVNRRTQSAVFNPRLQLATNQQADVPQITPWPRRPRTHHQHRLARFLSTYVKYVKSPPIATATDSKKRTLRLQQRTCAAEMLPVPGDKSTS